MGIYIGLDAGTTSLSAVAVAAEDGALLAAASLPNTATRHAVVNGCERVELNLAALGALAVRILATLVDRLGERAREVAGIGVTGQMHGLALLTPAGQPLAPAITWQDRRTLEAAPGEESTLERFLRLAGGEGAFQRMGCRPAPGYLGPSLLWLVEHGALPAGPAVACLVPDALVAALGDGPPRTDPTDAGSTALFDVVAGAWDLDLVRRLGLPAGLLAPVAPSGAPAGGLRREVAAEVGLPAGLPVANAGGDNQASFLGSVADPAASLLLNVGTGAQISAWLADYAEVAGLDTRPYPGGAYLLVGAGLFGGRSYAYLAEFFRRVGASLFDAEAPVDLYARMDALAREAPPGADGLRCAPIFTGTREDPALRGSLTGLTPENLTPGHLTRALLEGMAEGFAAFHARMAPALGARERLVGAGNGIRRNPLFAEILAARFRMPLAIPRVEESAAAGAALLAAVGTGEISDVRAAMARVRYLEG
jgi:sugar (pentulose or hexulose) kinase